MTVNAGDGENWLFPVSGVGQRRGATASALSLITIFGSYTKKIKSRKPHRLSFMINILIFFMTGNAGIKLHSADMPSCLPLSLLTLNSSYCCRFYYRIYDQTCFGTLSYNLFMVSSASRWSAAESKASRSAPDNAYRFLSMIFSSVLTEEQRRN